MTATSEQALLARVQRGDQAALGELLEAYRARLYNVCLRMVSNRDDAAELTQDAMLKVVQHIKGFRGEAHLSTWMIRIAMNQATSHLRKQKHRRHASLDHAPPNGRPHDDQATALRDRLADPREPGPEARVQQQEAHDRLHRALGMVDEEFRAVLVLRDLEQMDYRQIGEVLDLPLGTVKSRLFRARLALREQLQQMDPRTPRDPDPARRDRPT